MMTKFIKIWTPFLGFVNNFHQNVIAWCSLFFLLNSFYYLIHPCMSTRIFQKALPNTTYDCISISILTSRIDIKVKRDIYILHLHSTSKRWQTSSKLKLIQNPQFPWTLLANFWYFTLTTYSVVSNNRRALNKSRG